MVQYSQEDKRLGIKEKKQKRNGTKGHKTEQSPSFKFKAGDKLHVTVHKPSF
jgi:hypothetical protein